MTRLNPRDYQRRAIDSLYAYFEHRTGNPLLILPTGAGKSLLPAIFCQEVLARWAEQRFMVLAHVRELLEQNFEKIMAVWPDAPAGVYSAGLKRRDTRHPIIVAGIQSVFRKPHVFGWRDIVFIDEAHLLGSDSESMYQQFLAGLRETNPRLKIIGLTATAYRMRDGMLHQMDGSLFTDVACEVTLAELLAAGHICPLKSRPSEVQADLSGVELVGGEFDSRQMEAAMDVEELTRAALDEVFSLAGSRSSWLLFCAGVKHAGHVEAELRRRGKTATAVTGSTPPEEREAAHAAFRAGTLECLVSVGVHTTGFDAPNIDLIVLLVGTKSPGRYVQIMGRGMRKHHGKEDCLVLDYAGNIDRHGPITCVRPPQTARSRGPGEQHERTCLVCPVCRMASGLDAVECADCGHLFRQERSVRHDTQAATADIMAPPPEPEWLPLRSVAYAIHKGKDGKPDSLKVSYDCGLQQYHEWLCFDHPVGSFPRVKAEDWWRRRSPGSTVPASVAVAYGFAEYGLKTPCAIRVTEEGKFWRVSSYDLSKPAGYARPPEGGDDSHPGGGDSGFEGDSGEPILF
jgi:DNA repair protein RadD